MKNWVTLLIRGTADTRIPVRGPTSLYNAITGHRSGQDRAVKPDLIFDKGIVVLVVG